MKHFLVIVGYSQTDERTILVMDCASKEEAKRRARAEHPNAAHIWADGEVDDIIEAKK